MRRKYGPPPTSSVRLSAGGGELSPMLARAVAIAQVRPRGPSEPGVLFDTGAAHLRTAAATADPRFRSDTVPVHVPGRPQLARLNFAHGHSACAEPGADAVAMHLLK